MGDPFHAGQLVTATTDSVGLGSVTPACLRDWVDLSGHGQSVSSRVRLARASLCWRLGVKATFRGRILTPARADEAGLHVPAMQRTSHRCRNRSATLTSCVEMAVPQYWPASDCTRSRPANIDVAVEEAGKLEPTTPEARPRDKKSLAELPKEGHCAAGLKSMGCGHANARCRDLGIGDPDDGGSNNALGADGCSSLAQLYKRRFAGLRCDSAVTTESVHVEGVAVEKPRRRAFASQLESQRRPGWRRPSAQPTQRMGLIQFEIPMDIGTDETTRIQLVE